MDTYNPDRDFTDAFRERVAGWLQATGEVFVVLRYLRAGGQKDFLFCRSASEFSELLCLARLVRAVRSWILGGRDWVMAFFEAWYGMDERFALDAK